MKSRLQPVLLISVLSLFITCPGCFLISAPRSSYRPIHQYAQAGDIRNLVADLATNASDLNVRDDAGLTPLHLAAAHCHTNVVGLLLDRGARLNPTAKRGATPLHLAAQEGCADAVAMLLLKGAKVNPRDDQERTPLKRAEEWHQDAVAKLLREHGGSE